MRTAIHCDHIAKPVGPFSPAVAAPAALYVSGQVAQDPATGKLIAGSAAEQAACALNNVRAILASAGKTFDDVVRVGIYLTDMSDFAAVNEVYASYFTAPYPARTTIAVVALPLGAAVEVDVIASHSAP